MVFDEILFCRKDLLLKIGGVYVWYCLFVVRDVSLGCGISVVEDVFL